MKKGILKLFGIGYLGMCGMLLFGASSQAYVDPSVATYAVQAVAGIVIAIGAVAGICFRRAKKKLNDTLGIDENKNKVVESDDVVIK